MEYALAAVLALVVGVLGGFVGGVATLRNSGPQATSEGLAELGRLRLEWDAWRKGAEGVLEAMDDIADTVERKRRRMAARDSKEQANGAGPPPGSKSDLLARARALGIEV